MNNNKTMHLFNQVNQQRQRLEHVVAQALDLARSRSAAAEVAVTKTTGISISTRYGEVDNVEFNSDGVLRMNVYYQQRKGSASSTNLSQEAIANTVDAALNIVRYTSPDPASGLADKQLLAFEALDLDLFHPVELDAERGIALAAEAEQTALDSDKRITKTAGGNFNSHFSTHIFGNSHGMLQSYNSSLHSLSCSVIAGSGSNMERNYAYTIGRNFNDLRLPQWVGKECARRTVTHLYPRQLLTMEVPVLFAAEVTNGLFGPLVEAISGENVYRKSTFLLDLLGQAVLPDWLSIKEYPHLQKGLASSPFDSEGVRTRNLVIVQDGLLSTWLLNSYAARKLGLKSTGHAGGIYNWCISQQQTDLTGLLKQMDRGLMVTELMGQGINIITGDYSRGAAGFWVQNGEIQYAVSGITIAGNLRDMLRNIVSVGQDTETRSNIQCGSVLVSAMKIAGQ